jgi:copper homeostasis protein
MPAPGVPGRTLRTMSAPRPRLEACVTSVAEALAAVEGGAHRLELCRELQVGGLTPSQRLLEETRASLDDSGRGSVPVFCMVRPAPGPFRTDSALLAIMAREARTLRRSGAAGLVLGVLDEENRVDQDGLARLMEASDGVPVTFHRAFDQAPDPVQAFERVSEAGVTRILTGGGGGRAWEGRERLRELVRLSDQRSPGLTVLGAGGVRADHAPALVEHTGLQELHARGSAFPHLSRVFFGAGGSGTRAVGASGPSDAPPAPERSRKST